MKKILIIGMMIGIIFLSGCDNLDCSSEAIFYDSWIEAGCPNGCVMSSRQILGRNGCCMNISKSEYQRICK